MLHSLTHSALLSDAVNLSFVPFLSAFVFNLFPKLPLRSPQPPTFQQTFRSAHPSWSRKDIVVCDNWNGHISERRLFSSNTHMTESISLWAQEQGAERSRSPYWPDGGGEYRKGRDNWVLSLSTPGPLTPLPQQRHIPLNNGHFDQRGIPALRLWLLQSCKTQSTGVKDGGHTGYLGPAIVITTQWHLMLFRLCVIVRLSILHGPFAPTLYAHVSRHT